MSVRADNPDMTHILSTGYRVRFGGQGFGWFVARVLRSSRGAEFVSLAAGPYTTRDEAEREAARLAGVA